MTITHTLSGGAGAKESGTELKSNRHKHVPQLDRVAIAGTTSASGAKFVAFSVVVPPSEGTQDGVALRQMGMTKSHDVRRSSGHARRLLAPLALVVATWTSLNPHSARANSKFSPTQCEFQVLFPSEPEIERHEHDSGIVTTSAVQERSGLRLAASCSGSYPPGWLAGLSDRELENFILNVSQRAGVDVLSAERVADVPFRVFRIEGVSSDSGGDTTVISYWAYGARSRFIVEAIGKRIDTTGVRALSFFETLEIAN